MKYREVLKQEKELKENKEKQKCEEAEKKRKLEECKTEQRLLTGNLGKLSVEEEKIQKDLKKVM